MYVDKSDSEYSIHQLDREDLELIYEAVISYFNKFPNPPRKADRIARSKLVKLKKQIENEL